MTVLMDCFFIGVPMKLYDGMSCHVCAEDIGRSTIVKYERYIHGATHIQSRTIGANWLALFKAIRHSYHSPQVLL